jgi:phage gp46-like protein
MPFDRRFDPVTEDFVSDGRGGYERTTTAETSIYNQLKAHRGECWQDDELGSRLHDLDAMQADPALLAAEDARISLERLEADGRITAIEVSGSEPRPGVVRVDTKCRDTSTTQLVATHVTAKRGG